MKRLNKKLITFILAGACVASLGVATVGAVSTAAEEAAEPKTYTVSEVFTSNGTDKTATTVAYELANDQYLRLTSGRNLALKWQEKEGTKYLSVDFSFNELNFAKFTLEVETTSSVAEEKSTNAVEFTTKDGKLYAAVVNADTTDDNKYVVEIGETKDVKFSLKEGAKFDSFGVVINDKEISKKDVEGEVSYYEFTRIGANYAKYNYKSNVPEETIYPLEFNAATADGAKTTVSIASINGQSFNKVEDKKIKDDAAPVLVVNEEITTFQYGTQFKLDYVTVDVLQKTLASTQETKKYYQYKPTDTAVKYEKDLTSSTYFMDTNYEKDGKTTSVRKELGEEYVSIQYTLKDDSNNEKVYDLSWYAEDNEVAKITLGEVETEYIVINESVDGPEYTHITVAKDDTTGVYSNVRDPALDGEVASYQDLLVKAAKDVTAGSDSKITLPDVAWLLTDNGSYRSLKFNVSYKTPTSTSPQKSSELDYTKLKLTTSQEGVYEFKIYATDSAGNAMMYAHEGKLVEVTDSNIWDIEEIPSFTFTVSNSDIKVDEKSSSSSDRKVEKILDQTYTLSGLKVVGASNQKSEYALYRLDTSAYSGTAISESALISVKYEDIRTEVNKRIAEGTAGSDYLDLYLTIYAEKVAQSVYGETATADNAKAIKACFVKINPYNANVKETDPEWEEYNKYNWNATSKSFKTAEEGEYLILADFWEDGLFTKRAPAYKVIVVESEADVIKGDSKIAEWIKNNVVSVVLFGVAGLMLIAIIILLLVKPSDETLEEVEVKAEKKKAKKEKKGKDE